MDSAEVASCVEKSERRDLHEFCYWSRLLQSLENLLLVYALDSSLQKYI